MMCNDEIKGVGIGLKVEHFELMLQKPDYVDFVEIHAENYMVSGGAMPYYLQKIRDIYPLSLHGVGLSIGGDMPLDEEHIDRLKALIDRYQPQLFSEHLAWSSHGVNFYNDLLPLAYTQIKLNQVCEHIDHLQNRLQRQILLENPSTYIEFSANEMEETAFITEVVKKTGCGVLLDINNVYISAVNHQRDPYHYLQKLPLNAVQQMHIAGYSEDQDANGERILIDSHSEQVSGDVWKLYLHTLNLIGVKPTLLERDNNIPAFSELQKDLYQIQQAQRHYYRESGI